MEDKKEYVKYSIFQNPNEENEYIKHCEQNIINNFYALLSLKNSSSNSSIHKLISMLEDYFNMKFKEEYNV